MEQETQSQSGSKAGFVLILIVVAIASAMVAGLGASQLTATYLVNQALDKDARDVQHQVNVLRQLRAGDVDQTIEQLEEKLDDDLLIFDPKEPFDGLNEKAEANINQAIIGAKTYRAEYPRTSNQPHIDEMVNKLFERTK